MFSYIGGFVCHELKELPLQFDVFISHSSLDKNDVARPLAKSLESLGLKVWLDEEQLLVGDSIRRGIESALRESRFGVIILSPAYLSSEWGQKELDSFFTKEKRNKKSILPIYHGVSIEDVELHWPMLADKISLNTSDDINSLAGRIRDSIQNSSSTSSKQKVEFTRNIPPKKQYSWPSANVQWLIGTILALAGIVIPVWFGSGGPLESPKSPAEIADIDKLKKDLVASKKKINKSAPNSIAQPISEMNEFQKQANSVFALLKGSTEDVKKNVLKSLESGELESAVKLIKSELIERSQDLNVLSKNNNQSTGKLTKQLAADWVYLGDIAFLYDTYEALSAYKEATSLDSKNMQAALRQGHSEYRLNNLNESIAAFTGVLKSTTASKLDEAEAHDGLSLIYSIQNKQGKAQKSQIIAFETYEKEGLEDKVADSINRQGLIYFDRLDLSMAKLNFEEALKINKDLGRKEGMAVNFGNLGLIYSKQGELKKAAEEHRKALDIFKELGWNEGVADQSNNLGLVAVQQKFFETAEVFFLDALAINEKLGRRRDIASNYMHLGMAQLSREQYDASLRSFKRVLEIEKSIDNQAGVAAAKVNLGRLYLEQYKADDNQGSYLQLAEKLLKNAQTIKGELGVKDGLASISGNLGEIYQLRKKMGIACLFWEESIKLYNQAGDAFSSSKIQEFIDDNCKPIVSE